MVFYDKKGGEVIEVYPAGSDPHQRFWMVMDILFEADQRRFQRLLAERAEKNETIDSQIEECDKKVFRKVAKRSSKRYNLTQTARVVGVHRETLYYWIKKGWIKPKRDYRNYPVFTVLDIERLIEWKNAIKFLGASKRAKNSNQHDACKELTRFYHRIHSSVHTVLDT